MSNFVVPDGFERHVKSFLWFYGKFSIIVAIIYFIVHIRKTGIDFDKN